MRRLAPVFALYFLSPLVAEAFVGDFPITLVFMVLLLSPMYGGGALLIRELTRRTGRGWPTMLILALAFGVFEEGMLSESLFNPDYLGLHLLSVGFVPALGLAVPWTIYVLTAHLVWSISTPIALVEESTRERRTVPWLRGRGIAVAAVLFGVGSVMAFGGSVGMDEHHFVASPAQFGATGLVAAALVVLAFRLPRRSTVVGPVGAVVADDTVAAADMADMAGAAGTVGRVPAPWLVLVVTLVAGVAFMTAMALPVWGAGAAVMVLSLGVMAVLVTRWSRRAGWTGRHRLALAAGALFTYSWHAFTMHTATMAIDLLSHVVYALAAVGIVLLVIRQSRRVEPIAELPVQEVPGTEVPVPLYRVGAAA